MPRPNKKRPDGAAVRAVTYCRISHDPTGRETGVDRQRIDTDRIASDRGWTVVERIVDNDRSASRYARHAREGWTKLMALVEAGEVDALVAYDLDRLIRQPKELEKLIDLADRGLSVASATGLIDLATGGGRMVARTLGNVAAMEADRVSERQRAKLRHDAAQGRPHWIRRPFGYNLDCTINEPEAVWVRTMATWIGADGLSATETAYRLNAEGVAQPTRKPWQAAGVKALITSPRNVGKREYLGEVVGEATWPAIITDAEWRAASASLKIRSQGTRSGRRSMLTGLVKCGNCGRTMTRGTNGRGYAHYRCARRHETGEGCGQSIGATALDFFIAEMVLIRIGDVTARSKPAPGEPSTEAEQIRGQLADLADMLGHGHIAMAEWLAARAPLQARLEALERAEVHSDTSAALARQAGDTATLADRWHHLDSDLQRRLIFLVLDHVVVNVGRKGVLDLDRVDPRWKTRPTQE